MLSVIVLDRQAVHAELSLSIVLYAIGLGFFSMLLYFVSEYWRRWSFYQEVTSRLQGSEFLGNAATFTVAATREQKLFLQLLHEYQSSHSKELLTSEQKRQFYEMFVNRFAHQMKTPITVIQLLEDELRMSDPAAFTPERIRQLAGSFGEERARLNGAINTMLYTARLTGFSFDVHMEKVELLSLIRSVVNEHKIQWIRHRLFPRIECEQAQVYIKTDRKWLAFICEQIVRNALQYGIKPTLKDDKRQVAFVIRIVEVEEGVQVEFIDEGIGIPAEDVWRVFDPFYTGANGRTYSRATGMGLYLVKEVADNLGHQISLQSVEGSGTTVSLVLFQAEYHQVAEQI